MLTRDDTLQIQTWIGTAVEESETRVAEAIGVALREHTDRPPSERGVPSVRFGEVRAVYPDYAEVLFDGETEPQAAMLLADAGSGGGGTSVNYWAYSAGTLQPDPGTTTPLDTFTVQTTDVTLGTAVVTVASNGGSQGGGFVGTYDVNHQADIGINADNVSASVFFDAIGSDNAASLRVTAQDGGQTTVDLEVGEADGSLGALNLNGDGSFSLQADDGTTTNAINASSSGIEATSDNGGDGGTFTWDYDRLFERLFDGDASAVVARIDMTQTDLTLQSSDDITDPSAVSSQLRLQRDGSLALTATDGTTQTEVATDSGSVVRLRSTTGSVVGNLQVDSITAAVTADTDNGAGNTGHAWLIEDSFQVNVNGSTGMIWLNANHIILFSGVTTAPTIPGNSQFALWLDDTPGATKLMCKAKDSAGTVRTATIPLT